MNSDKIDQEKLNQAFREILRLESERLSELRPRNMPESIVQILKRVFSQNDTKETD